VEVLYDECVAYEAYLLRGERACFGYTDMLPGSNTAGEGVVLRLEHVCGRGAWVYRPAVRDMWLYVLVSFVFLARAREVIGVWILALRRI
jgi:hypothetical protein